MPIPTGGYRQMAEDLASRIRGGEYAPGDKLPSYAELSKLYSLAVTTVQKGIRVLEFQGLVVGVPGRGVYVREDINPNP
ncbi:winged helix-turn-helix domain-containing protein [Micromonospora sp. NPDC048839]|uniref:winged helix-turn-helix domain-containing protein n=1 Tax=Micromonospora sp. NPDC048839 TaxID=3155641 RepID=UPI0033F2765E